jgi:hypothetical protein
MTSCWFVVIIYQNAHGLWCILLCVNMILYLDVYYCAWIWSCIYDVYYCAWILSCIMMYITVGESILIMNISHQLNYDVYFCVFWSGCPLNCTACSIDANKVTGVLYCTTCQSHYTKNEEVCGSKYSQCHCSVCFRKYNLYDKWYILATGLTASKKCTRRFCVCLQQFYTF